MELAPTSPGSVKEYQKVWYPLAISVEEQALCIYLDRFREYPTLYLCRAEYLLWNHGLTLSFRLGRMKYACRSKLNLVKSSSVVFQDWTVKDSSFCKAVVRFFSYIWLKGSVYSIDTAQYFVLAQTIAVLSTSLTYFKKLNWRECFMRHVVSFSRSCFSKLCPFVKYSDQQTWF